MYACLDTETSMYSKDSKGKPTSNFMTDKILTIGLKYPNQEVIGLAQDHMPKGWLDGVTVLIIFHANFDLKFIWGNEELQEAFKRGLRVFDPQLVEYVLTGQQHKYPALRDIAVNKYGCKPRIKHIEGKLTQNVSIEELLIDVKNDALDLEQIALQQLKLVKDSGKYELIKARHDGLLALVECEVNGMMIDRIKFEKNKAELELDIANTQIEFYDLIGKYV